MAGNCGMTISNFGLEFPIKTINTKDWRLPISGFLIFELYATIKIDDIIALSKVNLRRLLMQMLEMVEHCPTEGETPEIPY
jgi:hypothetical protein